MPPYHSLFSNTLITASQVVLSLRGAGSRVGDVLQFYIPFDSSSRTPVGLTELELFREAGLVYIGMVSQHGDELAMHIPIMVGQKMGSHLSTVCFLLGLLGFQLGLPLTFLGGLELVAAALDGLPAVDVLVMRALELG